LLLPYEIYAVISGKRPVSFPENVNILKVDLLDISSHKILFELKPDILLHYAWAVQESGFERSHDNIQWLGISLRLNGKTAPILYRFYTSVPYLKILSRMIS
jgi:hypothetical protein